MGASTATCVMDNKSQSIAGHPSAMPSSAEISQAVAVTQSLLERLGLTDFQFSLEPRAGPWLLKLQTALGGGWYEPEVSIERRTLEQASDEHLVVVRNALLRVGLPLALH